MQNRMNTHVSKEGVYHRVDSLRELFKISAESYPLNVRSLCEKTGRITLRDIPLETRGLRGVAVLSHDNTHDIILLNSCRSMAEQNFDCGHELYHVAFHRDAGDTFNCLEHVKPCQNRFLEWQANEGSAELTVPYLMLLPDIKKECSHLKEWNDFNLLKFHLSREFGVTEAVIKFRFESLKFEIQQYLNGISLNNLQILSQSQQKSQNINVKSFNDIADELMKKELESHRIDIAVG